MQASNRETKGMGGTVEGDDQAGRRRWPETWPRADAWWLLQMRSHARDTLVVARVVHRRVFPALQRSDGNGGVLELLGTKVVMAGIRHNH